MRAGFGHSDITPPLGTKPTGSYRPRVMTGVHDPILAAACVIDDGNTPLALVGIDAGVILRETFDAAAAMIEQQTGIPCSNVVISASHTHQGGPSLSTFYATADPEYAKLVARGVADAVNRAWQSRADAELGSASGNVTGIHFNRRFLMRDGREATHPGKMNPDIVRPAGPVDDKLNALAFRKPDGALTGIIVNFGCHSTVTEDGNEYSADYVHYLREHLQRMLGPVEIVFLLGACGDVTQIDNQSPGWEKGHPWANTMGATLAAETARVIHRLTWTQTATCGVASQTVPITIRDHDYCEAPTVGLGSGDYWEPVYQREKGLVAQIREKNPIVDCHVTAMRIGEFALVTSGAELFAQPALDIQRASPFKKTWTITLANEYVGYVPTAAAHHAGGYEPRLARSSYLAPEAAQRLVEASLRALRDLTPPA